MNADDSIPIEGFDTHDWTMAMGLDDDGYHVAVVSWREEPMCRISLTDHFDSDDEARISLLRKARLWIADYLERSKGASH